MSRHTTALARAVVCLSTIVMILVLLLPATGNAEEGHDGATPTEYVVRPGDTLWGIAGGITPDGGDVRATVARIRAANDLDSSIIVAGEHLVLP